MKAVRKPVAIAFLLGGVSLSFGAVPAESRVPWGYCTTCVFIPPVYYDCCAFCYTPSCECHADEECPL